MKRSIRARRSSISQFKTIASRRFNLQAINYAIPGRYLPGSVDEDGITRHIQSNLATFPARYLVICYNIPPFKPAAVCFPPPT